MSDSDELVKARALFKSFHGRAPRPGTDEIATVGGLASPTVVLEVGQFLGIGYVATGSGEKFFHEFDAKRRPLVYVNSDGRQVYILKGVYRFTDRGFID